MYVSGALFTCTASGWKARQPASAVILAMANRHNATVEIRLILMLADAPSEASTVQQVGTASRRWDERRRSCRPRPQDLGRPGSALAATEI
jgi:hypothetical protein